MEIQETEYSVVFDASSATIKMQGKIRLQNLKGYDSIRKLLNEVAEKVGNGNLTLDLTELDSLNSSGITILSTFVIALRKANCINLKVISTEKHNWQKYSIPNLQKLWNKVQITLV